ncbi:MAG: TRAP transporter substrate-binding protein [Firmicutes bacterium]|nr:TRAP transporter substrate-binding protein [Bacillota bacterium]
MTVLLVLSLTLIAASCTQSIGSKNTETIKLSLAHFFPGTHPAETEFVQGWIKEVEKATGGRVIITSYPGETLLKAADIYKGVVEGVADIGLSCFSYTRGRFPVLEAFELPGIIYKNSKVASMVAWDGIKQLDPDEVKDTKLMMVIATGPGDLFTKTPVRNLNDLQGMEIRATGLSAKTIETLGGIPVGMAQSDAYEALQKGIVKGNLSPIEVLKGWNHADVTKYLTITPFLYNTLFFVTMNLNKWNSLPGDIQKAILEVNEKFQEEVGAGLWDKQNEAAFKWAVEEKGMEVIELSEEETAKWIEKVKPIQDEFEKKMKDMGIDKDILKVVKDLSKKYNDKY